MVSPNNIHILKSAIIKLLVCMVEQTENIILYFCESVMTAAIVSMGCSFNFCFPHSV